MKKIKINLKGSSYLIVVGDKTLCLFPEYIKKLKLGNAAYVITNRWLRKKYGNYLKKAISPAKVNLRFKIVADSERSKSLDTVAKVLKDLANYDKKRKVFVIALGGGVIGDLSGFVASIYKRGIPFVQIPTTLLAQVDSSIGGKTAVDLAKAKNLVGAFYQPKIVISDLRFLKTLDKRQIRSGLSEIIKYGIIKDAKLFRYLETHYNEILALRTESLEYVIAACVKIKSRIVELDEREKKGIRTILNFGHTLGHAIEAACRYKRLNHGEAVAIGMLIATEISKKINLLDSDTYKRIENILRTTGLPLKIHGITLNKILDAYYRDKKFIGNKNRLVLIEGIAKTRIIEDISLEVIKKAVKERFCY